MAEEVKTQREMWLSFVNHPCYDQFMARLQKMIDSDKEKFWKLEGTDEVVKLHANIGYAEELIGKLRAFVKHNQQS